MIEEGDVATQIRSEPKEKRDAISFPVTGMTCAACQARVQRALAAERKKLPLERVSVTLRHEKIHAEDCETCETKQGMLDRIDRAITLSGALDTEQRAKLIEIADKCPVHRTLESEIQIRTTEAPA